MPWSVSEHIFSHANSTHLLILHACSPWDLFGREQRGSFGCAWQQQRISRAESFTWIAVHSLSTWLVRDKILIIVSRNHFDSHLSYIDQIIIGFLRCFLHRGKLHEEHTWRSWFHDVSTKEIFMWEHEAHPQRDLKTRCFEITLGCHNDSYRHPEIHGKMVCDG